MKRSFKDLFTIAPSATDFHTHGFHSGDSSTQELLELSAARFVLGYNTALASNTNAELLPQLDQIEQQFRGFAYEGAGMALAILDTLSPWKRRFLPFTLAEGNDYIYLLYVGWGWSMGRLPRKQITPTRRTPYDALLRWLAYDGYGFHEGFFSWEKMYLHQRYPSRLPKGYARRAFDQGLGRGLWFVGCGDIPYIADCIAAFPLTRQPDLWSGIGLASTYAGGVSPVMLQQLRSVSASFYPHLAQGAAFASKARQRARNIVAHTQIASEILCGLPIDEVVHIVDSSLSSLDVHASSQVEPAFEAWRQRIRDSLCLPIQTR